MTDIIERTQQEAVRRLLNGQHSRTFYDGAHFAATITPEQVEAGARALFEKRSGYEWRRLSNAVQEVWRDQIRAVARAMGFEVSDG